jgi:antitoxin component of MazEF toxin-antitoxin module
LVSVLPVDEEAEDFDTQTIAEEVISEVRQAAEAEEGYTVQDISQESSRGIEDFLMLGQSLVASAVPLGMLMGVALKAVNLLISVRRVEEIEVTAGDKKIVVKVTDRYNAQKLIREFEEAHPTAAKELTKDTKVAVTGRVSKRKRKS